MILLNEPWSIYEQRIALERRRLAIRRALRYAAWAGMWATLGILSALIWPRL